MFHPRSFSLFYFRCPGSADPSVAKINKSNRADSVPFCFIFPPPEKVEVLELQILVDCGDFVDCGAAFCTSVSHRNTTIYCQFFF